MKNWKLNYFKKLEQFVQVKIEELESEGQTFDEDPFDVFLQECRKQLPDDFDRGQRSGKELNFDKGFLSFNNVLNHIGRKGSQKMFELDVNTVKSYMYNRRQPKIEQVKKFIRLSNGSLIYDSFYEEIDSPPFINK